MKRFMQRKAPDNPNTLRFEDIRRNFAPITKMSKSKLEQIRFITIFIISTIIIIRFIFEGKGNKKY